MIFLEPTVWFFVAEPSRNLQPARLLTMAGRSASLSLLDAGLQVLIIRLGWPADLASAWPACSEYSWPACSDYWHPAGLL